MSDGTVVKMYMPRMHKRDARMDLEDAEDCVRRDERILIAMAASGGSAPMPKDEPMWYEHVAREVPSILEEYAENAMRCAVARIMLENPEDCDDDYDPPTATHEDAYDDAVVEIVSNHGGAVVGRYRFSELGLMSADGDRQLGKDFHIRKATA